MKRIIYISGVVLLGLAFLLSPQALARTPPPTATSPLPTPTPLPVQAIVTLTPAVTPTPAPLDLPGDLGEWLKFAATLIKRLGLWVTLGLLLLVLVLSLVSKAFRELLDAAAKRWATRAQDNWYTFWLRRRTPPEIRDYLDGVVREFKNLELASIARRDVDRFGYVSLESVYVPLLTPAGGGMERTGLLGRRIVGDTGGEPGLLVAGEGEERGHPLTQLLPEHRCLVLVGEAGSGKTTFLRFVALALARACREKGPRWARRHLGWAPRPLPVPVFLSLGGFGSWLDDRKRKTWTWPAPACSWST